MRSGHRGSTTKYVRSSAAIQVVYVARNVQRGLSMLDQGRDEPGTGNPTPIPNANPVRWIVSCEDVERPWAHVH